MNSLGIELTDKRIRLLEEYNDAELNKEDVFIVDGGFGSNPNTIGTALFIKNERTGKIYRINGMDKIKEVKK